MSIIKARIITLTDNHDHVVSANKTLKSIKDTGSQVSAKLLDATTPVTLSEHARQLSQDIVDYVDPNFKKSNFAFGRRVMYKYPVSTDPNTVSLYPVPSLGLVLKSYNQTQASITAACSISHMRVWMECIKNDESMIVLEDDAIFTQKLQADHFLNSKVELGACSINTPVSTKGVVTRKGAKYIEGINKQKGDFVCVPTVNEVDEYFPQGLPGGSAYYIEPWAMRKVFKAIEVIGGLWPNDAFLCKEIFPWLKVSKTFYTDIQGTASSTTK